MIDAQREAMKEVVPYHLGRLFVYTSLSMLIVSSVYCVYFVTEAHKRSILNAKKIDDLEDRMTKREAVAAIYVPRLEKTEDKAKIHDDLMQSILIRQKEIMTDYLKILKGSSQVHSRMPPQNIPSLPHAPQP